MLIASLALGAIGTGVQVVGAQKQVEAQKKAERERKRAMELDARRKNLEILRNQQKARALALTAANAQGASFGSTLEGAYGQISGQTNTNAAGVFQNLEIGRNIFDANMDLASAQGISSLGQGFSSLGSSLFSTSQAFGRLGTLTQPGAQWGGYNNPNKPGSLY